MPRSILGIIIFKKVEKVIDNNIIPLYYIRVAAKQLFLLATHNIV